MEIRVTLYDPEGTPGPALLPDNVPLHRLIPALIDKLNLPEVDDDDSMLIYSLYRLPSGELIPDEMTLVQAGIENGGSVSLEMHDTGRDVFTGVNVEAFWLWQWLLNLQSRLSIRFHLWRGLIRQILNYWVFDTPYIFIWLLPLVAGGFMYGLNYVATREMSEHEETAVSITDSTPTNEPRPLDDVSPTRHANYYDTYPDMIIDSAKEYEAIIRTAKGDMRLYLFDDASPLAVNNFVFLSQQGFYDGLTFHRVIEGFMAQGGDPNGDGTGGAGYQFADEADNGLAFDRRGLLAMANAGRDTNSSQFFITFAPMPHLDGLHTIFGEVIEGDEVLDQITRVSPGQPGDVIERIDIVER